MILLDDALVLALAKEFVAALDQGGETFEFDTVTMLFELGVDFCFESVEDVEEG